MASFAIATVTTRTAMKRSSGTSCPWCTRFLRQQQQHQRVTPPSHRARATRYGLSSATTATAAFSTSTDRCAASASQPSFWSLLIPKPFRSSTSTSTSTSSASSSTSMVPNARSTPGGRRSKGGSSRFVRFWRFPATPFMMLGLLLGSQSVRLIVLRMDRERMREKTEARLRTLREVLEAVMAGEDVDVRARLGTGKEQDEREWEEVIRNLATDEIVLKSRRAAWRERKEAQKRDMQQRAAADADTVDTTGSGAAAAQDGAAQDTAEKENTLSKEAMKERKRRKAQAAFY